MGTWLTFSIGQNQQLLNEREDVLRIFFKYGGGMIDSSPMYANSEEVVGKLLARLKRPETLFSATKIWTPLKRFGPTQLANSRKLWGVNKARPLNLVHVHNLLKLNHHLPMLQEQKEQGRVQYVGLTTSHGRRHDRLEKLLNTETIDFTQFTYNILDRNAENRLLPAALDNGVAVVINRPFQTGALFRKLSRYKLPQWAAEIGCYTWAQFFLKFVISHPAVTCAIPATRQASHMHENMKAGQGSMPDTKTRAKMVNYVEKLL